MEAPKSNSFITVIKKSVIVVMLTLLVLSFAVWDIGGLFRGGGDSSVATVGDTTIEERDWRDQVAQEAQRLQQQLGASIDADMMRQFGIEQSVLQQMIHQRLLDIAARDVGLTVGDRQVVAWLAENEQFFSRDAVTGKYRFDRTLFQQFLRQQGLREPAFLAEQKQRLATGTLIEGIYDHVPVPGYAVSLIMRYAGERRVIETIRLLPEQVKMPSAPDDEVLRAFYDTVKGQFMSPETRSADVLRVGLKDIEDSLDLSDARLKEEYEAMREVYVTPEQRELKQLLLNSHEEAQKAQAALDGGKSFLHVVQDAGKQEEDTNYGRVTQEEMLDTGLIPEVAVTEIFSAEEGDYTAPVQTVLGWHIFLVERVIPAEERRFEDVKGELHAQLLVEEGPDALYSVVTAIEDELASGANIQEVASRQELDVQHVEDVTRGGDGTENLPEFGNFLGQLFATEPGDISPVVTSDEGDAYYFFEVTGISEAQERPLEAVKQAVIASWQAKQRDEALKKQAENAGMQLQKAEDAGEMFAQWAKEWNQTVETTEPLTRFDAKSLPASLLETLFHATPGVAAGPHLQNDGSYLFALLKEVQEADPEDRFYGRAAIASSLENGLQNEALMEYLAYLSTRYPVEVIRDFNNPLESSL